MPRHPAPPIVNIEELERKAWPYRWAMTLDIDDICGGIPSDPKVAEGWIRKNVFDPDELLMNLVTETMAERNILAAEATAVVADLKTLNGFKRDSAGGLFIEGRQVKAAFKEAANVAAAAGKVKHKGWGLTNKWILAWTAEHVHVVEQKIPLGVAQPARVDQHIVKTPLNGSSLRYSEVVEEAKIEFTVKSDHDWNEEDWEMIWFTGGTLGLGAQRAAGYGRYVASWIRLS